MFKFSSKIFFNSCFISRFKSTMKILNVAEKNDAAKNIAKFLSRGNSNRREGFSKFNKIYEFQADVFGKKGCTMIMTSVSGHLMELEFTGAYRSWHSISPVMLFEAPVQRTCPDHFKQIKKTLEKEVKGCQKLIIWTDCDREGENIGSEIAEVCLEKNPRLQIHRAIFSEITSQSAFRALNSLEILNQNVINAVNVRQELDLRIGAAFTRFQTLRLQKVFPALLSKNLISYGTCQFPTLGFVVERYKEIENFISENFWVIEVKHKIDNLTVQFKWDRERLFDKDTCTAYFQLCQENPLATVISVVSKPKHKWRPEPLDTVEMEKSGSRKLKITAKETMTIAEKLYQKGFISYPRTETNIFPPELKLEELVQQQFPHNQWGSFAQRIMNEGGPTPRQGKKTDKAHPPIHPTKLPDSDLSGNEARLYEFITRHFLACCHKDALGHETIVQINISDEKFTANGLVILERNYLDVYPYDKWSGKEIHNYQKDQQFNPTSINMRESKTEPPHLLTEADLIALMEKHGIGTDATHAEHIEKIKQRLYIGIDGGGFVPGQLGMGLVDGYDEMGFAMSKPHLRAELESDLKKICEGQKDHKRVLKDQIHSYKSVFQAAVNQAVKLDHALAKYLTEQPQNSENIDVPNFSIQNIICKCPLCKISDMTLRRTREERNLFISCLNYPTCKNAVWFPKGVEEVTIEDEDCPNCQPPIKRLKFKFRTGFGAPRFSTEFTSCLGGCDRDLLMFLGIQSYKLRGSSNSNDSPPDPPPSPPPAPQNRRNGPSQFPRGSPNTKSKRGSPKKPQTKSNTITPSRSFSSQSYSSNQTQNTNRRPMPANNPITNYFSMNSRNDSTDSGYPNDFRDTFSQDSDNPIYCSCNKSAKINTVTKSGSNQGRHFYSCSTRECNFFLWKEPEGDVPVWLMPTGEDEVSTTTNQVECKCHQTAKILQVRKDGPNKDREFYGCPHTNPNQRCNFFQWVDEVHPNGRNQDDYGSNMGFESQSSGSSFRGGNSKSNSNLGRGGKTRGSNNNKRQASGRGRGRGGGRGGNQLANLGLGQLDRPVYSQPSTSYSNFSSPSRFSVTTNDTDDSEIKCNCNLSAFKLTVNKDGPNKGRLFYKCAKMPNECNFFKWVDEVNSNPTRFNMNSANENEVGSNFSNENATQCQCERPAAFLTVQKNGPNKGRQFYSCPNRTCNFFQWADESSTSGTSQGRGVKRPASDNNSGTKAKRKCGICSNEGHNRKNCPFKD